MDSDMQDPIAGQRTDQPGQSPTPGNSSQVGAGNLHPTEKMTVVGSPNQGTSAQELPPTLVVGDVVCAQTLVGDASVAAPVKRAATLGRIGDYELLSELGRGGMGIVYQARQIGLNRLVALKTVLAQAAATPEDVQRFRNEAEAAANLRHPGIVAIYEVGQAAGRHYYSMEFIAGNDLSRLIRNHALAADLAARYLVQLADAVQYAHEHGVLHRDLKPSNVLVDAGGAIKITDFGLAKRIHADSQLTGAGMVMGTPSYMSPEQALPSRGPLGPACDVYALGAVLYELVTCRPPFRAENPLETIRQLLHDDPIAPRQLNRSIPLDLETICLKCLEKEPARRYESAATLAAELRRFLAGEPIQARPINRAQRAWRWCRRNPRDAALIGSIAAAVVLGMCGVAWQWQRAEVHVKRAERNFDLLSKASDEMLHVVEEWVTRAPPRAGAQQEQLNGTLQLFETFLLEEPTNMTARERLAATHQRVADIRRQLRQLPLAAKHYRLAIEQYEQISADSLAKREWQRRIADAWDSLGNTEREAERFESSREAFDMALGIQARLVDEGSTPKLHGDLARTLYNRGLLRFQTGKVGEARQDFDRAIELLETALSAEPQEPSFRQGLARCLINLGVVCRDQREPQAAVDKYERAIEILGLLHRDLPVENEYASELAQAHMNRGNLLLTFRQQLATSHGDPLTDATDSFQESIRILRGLSRDYPNVPEYRIQLANALNGSGATHQVSGKQDAAQSAFEQARDQFFEILSDGNDSGDVRSRLALTLANLALLKTRETLNERILLLQQAVEHQQMALRLIPASTTIPGYLRSHRRALARAQLQGGDYTAASQQARELGKLDVGRASGARDEAEILVGARQACQQDRQLLPEERDRLMEDYAGRAVKALARAVQSDSVDVQQLAVDAAFASLRDRADFQELLSANREL